ncbi:MAG: acyl carrier protein [Desulfuromonadaceae bacterium]
MDIITELNSVFRQVFDDSSLTVTRATTANDIDEWDSLTHMNLVVAVELKFGVKFALGELQLLKNVGDMADMVGKKMK